MPSLLLLLCFTVLQLGPGGPADFGPTDLGTKAFIEIEVDPGDPFVGEPFALRLRFGIEREFLERQVVSRFRRDLDVDVQLLTPWLDAMPGTARLGDATAGHAGEAAHEGTPKLSFARSEFIGWAQPLPDRKVDGRSYKTLQLRQRYAAEFHGTLVVPATTMSLAYATAFEDHYLDGRSPLDSYVGTLSGETLHLSVVPLPEAGRPVDFGGAVGNFTLSATTVSASPTPPESEGRHDLALLLTIEGDGADAPFPSPALDHLEGFLVLDQSEQRNLSHRSITYELSLRDAKVTAVPPVSFSFFDPGRTGGEAGYVTVRTEPIPLAPTTRVGSTGNDPAAASVPREPAMPTSGSGAESTSASAQDRSADGGNATTASKRGLSLFVAAAVAVGVIFLVAFLAGGRG